MKNRILLVILLLLSFNFTCIIDEGSSEEKLKRRDPYVGRRFHEKTKMIWGQVAKTASILTERMPAPIYKIYPEAEKIKLPLPNLEGKALEKVIKEILPDDNFTGEAISLAQLSQILFTACGIIKKEGLVDIRTVSVPLPRTLSFSYMHPIEIYILATRIQGLKQGLYHYSFIDHALELIKEGSVGMPNCCFESQTLDKAAASIILTGIPRRLTWGYDARSYRYIYMVAGAVSQNIYLQCASLSIGSIGTASFDDDAYNDLLGIDGETEITLLLHLLGKVKR